MIASTVLTASLLWMSIDNITTNYDQLKVAVCKSSPKCNKMAEMAYYEARGESDRGVKAVMEVVLNRTEHPRFPNTVRGVVNQPHAFSYILDGSIKRAKNNKGQWERMYLLAFDAIFLNKRFDMKGSTHYHSTKVVPKWSKSFKRVAKIGNHLFYKCSKHC